MNLNNKTIQSTYGNLLTVGSTAGSPTQGTLQNGAGQDVIKLVVNEIEVTKLIQPQGSIAANGASLSSATLLNAGVNLVTSADSNNIAVKLPAPQLGLVISVVNTSSRDISVFPHNATDSVLGLPVGTASVVPADNQLYQFICVQNPTVGVWSVTTPSQNGIVRKSVSVNLLADGTLPNPSATTSTSSSPLLTASQTIFNPGASQTRILDSPANNVDWIDANEFNIYSEHRITEIVFKSNVLAGDLTTTTAQQPDVLMGLTNAQFGAISLGLRRVVQSQDTLQLSQITDLTGAGFSPIYSFVFADGTQLQLIAGLTHYMKTGSSSLYQQYTSNSPNGDWRPINDVNGNRSIYYSPYIQYGSAASPATNYPASFDFSGEMIVKFEFR